MRPHVPALTSVRFFAALYVLLVHFGTHILAGTPLNGFAELGSTGVSMFFVLSGFILTYNYAGRPMAAGAFWWARFARIWPVYLVSLAFSLPAYWSRMRNYLEAYGDSPWHLAIRYLTATQAWTFDGDAIRMTAALNNPSWSISTEVGFYLLFPLLLPALWRLSTRTFLTVAAVGWVCTTLPAWMLSYGLTLGNVNEEVVYKMPVFRLGEFLLGMAAATVFIRHPEEGRLRRLGWPAWALACAFLVAGLAIGLPRRALVSGALGPVFALVVLTLAAGGGPSRPLSWRPLVFLGEASYAFYLAHYPVALYIDHFVVPRDTNAHFLLTLSVTLCASVVAYVAVEKPTRTWLRRLVPARRGAVPIAR